MTTNSPNIIDKLWSLHSVATDEGCPTVLAIDAMLIHEVTSPQAFQFLEDNNLPIAFPEYLFGTLDLSIPTRQDRHMSIECGARGGLVGPDEVTFSYLKNRLYAPSEENWEDAVAYWISLSSAPNAH